MGYTPMRSNKKGKQYHYYVSQNRVQDRNHPKALIGRLPAYEIETLVLDAMKAEIRDVKKLSGMLSLDLELHFRTLDYLSKSADALHDAYKAISRVIIDCNRLTLEICPEELAKYINETMGFDIRPEGSNTAHRIEIPYHTRRAHRGAVMIRQGDGKDPLDLPKTRLEALVKGIVWRDEHFSGKSFHQIATENGCSEAQVGKLIQQSFEIA